jgi:hypothetical protein
MVMPASCVRHCSYTLTNTYVTVATACATAATRTVPRHRRRCISVTPHNAGGSRQLRPRDLDVESLGRRVDVQVPYCTTRSEGRESQDARTGETVMSRCVRDDAVKDDLGGYDPQTDSGIILLSYSYKYLYSTSWSRVPVL